MVLKSRTQSRSKTRGSLLRANLSTGRIKRGITQHSATQLMTDATRAGFVWHGQLTGELIGRFLVGGVVEDTMGKYMENLAAGNKQGNVSLANERT